MKLSDSSNSIRFSLYVFIFLVVFCIAQLTWWIIYQYSLNQRLFRSRLEIINLEIQTITDMVNNDFGRLSQMAVYGLQASNNDQSRVEKCLDNLLTDEALIGYQMLDHDGRVIKSRGIVDSTFYFYDLSGLNLYFNPDYPRRMIAGNPPNLEFNPGGYYNGRQDEWVQTGMYKISPTVFETISGESRKGLMMFAFEGSFFMIIVLSGAFLIYRTLQKSEDLKARQVNFMQSITHEFRTPLTSIKLYIEAIQSGQMAPPQAKEIYLKIIEDCDRLDGLIDNILEAGYLSRDKYELKLRVTDLAEDIQRYLRDLKPYVMRQSGILEVNLQEDIRARTDYETLGRAFRAIIDNALKYSPPDRRLISISLSRAGKSAIITISDKGIGISAQDRNKIFDRFYRASNTGAKVKGTGLGLYLVRNIIQAHKGTIEVSSAGFGQGSQFIVKLPLVET